MPLHHELSPLLSPSSVLGSGPAYYLGTGRRISEGQGEGKANPMAKIDPGAAPYLTTLPEARGHTRGGVYHRHGLGSDLVVSRT